MKPTEWGNAISYGWIDGSGDTPEERRANGFHRSIDLDEVIKTLRSDAEATLPPGSRYEIRRGVPTNYGRTNSIGWYRSTKMDDATAWGVDKTGYINELGYILVEQSVTPPVAKR